jgi:hypothetical protein
MGDEYDENEFEEDFGDADEPGNYDKIKTQSYLE